MVRKFTVCRVYEAVLSSDNQLVCQTSLPVMQRVNAWNEEQVSAFEVKLKKEYRDEESGMEVASTVYAFSSESEPTMLSRTLLQSYPTIFSWTWIRMLLVSSALYVVEP